MPRPPRADLASIDQVDTTALLRPGEDDLIAALEDLIRIANSDAARRRLMTAAGFPAQDIPTFLALNQLALHGALRPTDLAERLETGRPNVTKIVQRLNRIGLAVRVADPHDDRGVLVALTGAGRELAERVVALEREWFGQAISHWSEADVEALTRLAGNLTGDLAALLRSPPPLSPAP